MVKPVIIAGPSGVGKSYILELLVNSYSFEKIVGTNTRQPRIGEVNGVDAYFVNVETYLQLRLNCSFFMDSFFLGNYYGYERKAVEEIDTKGKTPIAITYTATVIDFLRIFPSTKAFFLMPISMNFLEERMRRRGDAEQVIHQRLANAKKEIEEFRQIKHLFVQNILVENDDISVVLQTIFNQLEN